MTLLVVDASVALKWVIPEDGSILALALRREHRFTAPDLLIAECANVLWKQVRRGFLSEEQAFGAADVLSQADIDLKPMRPLIAATTRLAIALNHPAYDCFYLALAIAEDCPFVTADERLVRKVEAAGSGPDLRLLSSFAV